jgi:hypothetical protein
MKRPLLKRAGVVSGGEPHPALGVVVLGRAGDEAEVLGGDFVGIDEAAAAFLLDGINKSDGFQ